MKAAAPSMHAYMAKDDGRYAALAWKFPGLATSTITNHVPVRGDIVRLIDRYRSVCARAQIKPNTYRTK